jgi:hypothetical protein
LVGSKTGPKNDGGGAWIYFGKEGGEHIRGSIQSYYVDRKLDLNRMGFLERSDMKGIEGWMQYRTTKTWWIIRKTWNNINFSLDDNLSNVTLTRGGNFNASVELTNFWELGGGVWTDFEVQYDDRETRGGPLVTIPIGQSWWFWLNTDSRKWWQINPNIEGGDSRDGHYNYYGLWLELHPKSNIEFSGGPGYMRSDGVSRWLDTLADVSGKRTDDIFGEQHVRRFDMTIRGTFTFSKDLTLQIYAQPFLAAVDYRNFKKLISPDRFEYVDESVYNEQEEQPDFNRKSFNSNIVLRWEYRPGSTLFLVWTQSRKNYDTMGDFKFKRDWDNLFDTIPGNTFLIKLDYWWSI